MPFIRLLACFSVATLAACSQVPSASQTSRLVVLDIGHSLTSPGACTPSAVGGRTISECDFWHQYAATVKQEVQRAGLRCAIINRGNPPATDPLLSYARAAGVSYLRHPDTVAERYPSHYFPDRVASGMVSADYAIYNRAACIVFLHHNSSSNRWTSGASPSVILRNKYNGGALAEALRSTVEHEILNHGMPNDGRGCGTEVRCVDADRAAGWLNACDDAGIPAAVVESAFLNNRAHAAFLATEAGARAYARAVGRGIVRFMRISPSIQRHVRANPDTPDQGSFGYAIESRRLHVPGAKLLTR